MKTFSGLELLDQLYSSVSSKGFEILVRDILESLGFDDIMVTGRSGDSGIDLTATLRKSEIPGIDTSVSCIVQAKKYKPEKVLNPKIVRELRGSMQSGQRGILITTARVSSKTIEEEALMDMSRIVLVIDGQKLIQLCKDKGIGVLAKYELDEDYISKLETSEPGPIETEFVGTKLITLNDIRARILRIPKELKQLIQGKSEIVLHFDDGTKQSLKLDKQGNYLGGVTPIYHKYGLIDADGNPHEMFSEWQVVEDGVLVRFKKAEYEERPNIVGILEGIFGHKFTRLPGTSVFAGNGHSFLCRYSKRYPGDINYWYGITPKDIAMMEQKEVDNLAFFCSTAMVAFIDRDSFMKQIGNLNVTETEAGEVRHYHIQLKEAEQGLLWVLKGRATLLLHEVRLVTPPHQ